MAYLPGSQSPGIHGSQDPRILQPSPKLNLPFYVYISQLNVYVSRLNVYVSRLNLYVSRLNVYVRTPGRPDVRTPGRPNLYVLLARSVRTSSKAAKRSTVFRIVRIFRDFSDFSDFSRFFGIFRIFGCTLPIETPLWS